EHVIEGGVDFLVSLGTTGEAVTLNAIEAKEVLQFTIKVNQGRKPLVAGMFGDNNTARLIDRIQNFSFEGVDAIMSSSPSYNKPSQEGIFLQYQELAKVSPLPIIIYNVPSRTGSNVEAKTTLRLANSSEKFIAVKEASGDLHQAGVIAKHKPPHFSLLSGDDPITLPLYSIGATGAISVVANALPRQFSGITKAVQSDNWKLAKQLHLQLHELHPLLYVDCNPSGIKGAMELLGLCNREVRLPLAPLGAGTMEAIKAELQKLKVI
ncbi:MAG: 4-hydroxy-tetrahydrodipicolinate synthase, partial [Phaeodactylibacter sp.]|nr:4-hydroxy-tetrahydrodipicolinate synthase [Phaeodactylibacter sp.]